MEFKFSVLFGIILAIIVLAVANGVFMVDPAYVSPAAIATIIIFTLIFTKLYLGKVSVDLAGIVTVSIVWVIVVAIIEAIVAYGMGLDLTTYYSNYMIYVGYILIIILAVIGFKLFSGKGAAPAAAPAEKPAPPAETPPV
jgi:CDP-diglyceride synthetase